MTTPHTPRPAPDKLSWRQCSATPPQMWVMHTHIGGLSGATRFRLEQSTAGWRFTHYYRPHFSLEWRSQLLLELPPYLSEEAAMQACETHYWLNAGEYEWTPTPA